LLLESGRFADAEAPAREALELREREDTERGWVTVRGRQWVGESLLGQGKYSEAEQVFLQAYAGLEKVAVKYPQQAQQGKMPVLGALVRLYRKWNRPAEAALWEQRGLDHAKAMKERGDARAIAAFQQELRKFETSTDKP